MVKPKIEDKTPDFMSNGGGLMVAGEHSIRDIADLRPGDHLCCLFETEEEHRALVTPYILLGLERGEKVVYIVDAHTSEEILVYLQSDDLDMQACLDSGQLSILTRDDAYMREGTFDPDGMISLLRSETDLAIEQGYTCLRVTGEMTWALRGLPGSERLIEYEAKLNEFFPGSLCMAICQYDRRRFSPAVLLDVLTTHPVAVVGTRIYRNPYFMLTEEFLREDRTAATLAQWLRNLEDRYLEDEALRESEETLQIIFDSMPGLLFFKDKNNILLRVNKALCEALGMPAEEIEGRALSELFPDHSEEYWKDDLEVIEFGKPKLGIHEPMETPQGTMWLQTDKVPYRNPDGEVEGIIGFSVDITERKRAEEELERINNELEAYAQIVSHDLRGPISVITSAISTIEGLMERYQGKQAMDQIMKVADMIKRSSLRAEVLIDNLLSLARAGQVPNKVSEVDIRGTIERVLEEKTVPIEEKKIKVIMDEDLGHIMADPTHIYQLFTNLIGNALAYNDNPDPEIRITHKEEDGAHRYQVRDNGSGIPPEDAEKVFLPLCRGKEGDTGIGLAIVKKTVNVYNGDITVYNDGGACFEFTIKDFHQER